MSRQLDIDRRERCARCAARDLGGCRPASVSSAWSQVISRYTAIWSDRARLMVDHEALARGAPGAPATTTTGERSA
jgi:hypothetical protein